MMTRRCLIQSSWKIFITVLLFSALAACSLWVSSAYVVPGTVYRIFSAVVFYVILLLTIGWLLYITSRWFRSRLFLMSGFVVLFVWGSVSYFCWPVDLEDGNTVEPTVTHQIQSVNRLLTCFFSGSLMETAPSPATRFNYEILHFFLIFYLGAWVFSLWGQGVVNRLRRHATLDRHLNVFWGVNDQGLALARDILAHSAIDQVEFNIPVKIFDADKGDTEVRRLDGLDVVWLAVDFNRFSRSFVKGRAHYFLSPSGEKNIQLANALARFLPERDAAEKKTFHIRIKSKADEQMFSSWAEGLRRRVDVVFVRESEMVARQLMMEYPVLTECPGISFIPKTACVNGSVRLLVIGFGSVGWDIVEQMVCGSRFTVADGSELPFECVVVDDDDSKWDAFNSYCPEAKDSYNLRFVQKNPLSSDFADWVASQVPSFNRIVLDLADDGDNVELLACVEKAFRFRLLNTFEDAGESENTKPCLFVRISNAEIFACVEGVRKKRAECGSRLYARTRLFGSLDQIYRASFLDYDELYEIASTLNAYHKTNGMRDKNEPGWLRQGVKRERSKIAAYWAQSSFDDRLSSISSAAGERNAMLLLGCRLLPAKHVIEDSDVDSVSRLLEDGIVLDRLARNEHYRWNAWHRMHGYCVWDLMHPPIEREQVKKANKLSDFGRHAAIVPYDTLPDVDLKIASAIAPEEARLIKPEQLRDDGQYPLSGKSVFCMQYWDRAFCRSIPRNIAAAGYSVVLDRP